MWDLSNGWNSIDMLELDDEDTFWQRLQEYVENHPDQDLMA